MANVSVLNMQGQEVGTIDLNDAIFGVRSPEEAESPGDRRVPAMRARVQPELPSGRAAALCSHPFPATIPSR